jgi:hypothetical protein
MEVVGRDDGDGRDVVIGEQVGEQHRLTPLEAPLGQEIGWITGRDRGHMGGTEGAVCSTAVDQTGQVRRRCDIEREMTDSAGLPGQGIGPDLTFDNLFGVVGARVEKTPLLGFAVECDHGSAPIYVPMWPTDAI